MSDLQDFLKLSVLPEPRPRLIILLFLIFLWVQWRSGLRLFVGCMVRTARGGNSFAGEVWIWHCKFLGDSFVVAEVDQLHFKLSTDTEDHRFVGSSSEWMVDAVTRQLVTRGAQWRQCRSVSRILSKQRSWASDIHTAKRSAVSPSRRDHDDPRSPVNTEQLITGDLTEVRLDRSHCP